MSAKQQLAEVIASVPESASLEEAFERLYAAFKEKLRRESIPPRAASPAGALEERFLERAERQYALASRHPGEFVVLVDNEVVSHSPDPSIAMAAYQGARNRPDGSYPVLIGPDAQPPTIPIVRGRSLTRA